jgi:hypothetical protein
MPPLEEYGQQMGVEQSTPLDFRSLPHPNSLASNCEKDFNLESKKGDNLPNLNVEDYLFNDEVAYRPQRCPLPFFAHVALVVETTSANNTTSIFAMASMNKLNAPTLATLTAMTSTSIVEHVHNNCNCGGPSQGQIREYLEGQGHVGVHMGKPDRPSSKEMNIKDLSSDNDK